MFECPVAHQRQWPQTGQEGGDDVVALLDAADARAALLDDAGALVAADDREAGDDVAVAQVLVGVAEARRHPADQHLVGLGLVELELGDLPVGAGVPQHRCLGLHEALLPRRRWGRDAIAPRLPRRCRTSGDRGGGLREAGVGAHRAAVVVDDRRVPELVRRAVDELVLEDLLDALVLADDVVGRAQPGGADALRDGAVAGAEVAELRQVEVEALALGRAQALVLGELVERLGQARELADRRVVGAAGWASSARP